ncbi:hypothetical protein [Ralstonia solanacearum]|uniref:hypothetical protein n=1 Tax=Ralstonia solanacearum TaxID=305 RepID=UPI0015963307|nr:hypothetical protein [Ralstonia solanacearum]
MVEVILKLGAVTYFKSFFQCCLNWSVIQKNVSRSIGPSALKKALLFGDTLTPGVGAVVPRPSSYVTGARAKPGRAQ